MAFFHLVARAIPPHTPLRDPDAADWLWARLREAFPQALAAVLMPNHPHLVVPGADADVLRRALAAILSGLSRHGAVGRWAPVPEPEELPDAQHLLRTLRYTALNPCRKGIVPDPLNWPWSTHRDLVGAIADPWVTPERLSHVLGRGARGFARHHHAYVSGDPSVAVGGTAFPEPRLVGGDRPALLEIAAAAASATRGHPDHIARRSPTRRAFLALSCSHGWEVGTLAQACGMTARGVREALAEPAPGLLAAASLCLGDARLLYHPTWRRR